MRLETVSIYLQEAEAGQVRNLASIERRPDTPHSNACSQRMLGVPGGGGEEKACGLKLARDECGSLELFVRDAEMSADAASGQPGLAPARVEPSRGVSQSGDEPCGRHVQRSRYPGVAALRDDEIIGSTSR